MSRHVWIVQTTGETETLEIFGTLKRAVDHLVDEQEQEVFDEEARPEPITDATLDPNADAYDVMYSRSDPTRRLTRREVFKQVRKDGYGQWSLDGAGNTILSLARRRLR